jgi:hypothetical protein
MQREVTITESEPKAISWIFREIVLEYCPFSVLLSVETTQSCCLRESRDGKARTRPASQNKFQQIENSHFESITATLTFLETSFSTPFPADRDVRILVPFGANGQENSNG